MSISSPSSSSELLRHVGTLLLRRSSVHCTCVKHWITSSAKQSTVSLVRMVNPIKTVLVGSSCRQGSGCCLKSFMLFLRCVLVHCLLWKLSNVFDSLSCSLQSGFLNPTLRSCMKSSRTSTNSQAYSKTTSLATLSLRSSVFPLLVDYLC